MLNSLHTTASLALPAALNLAVAFSLLTLGGLSADWPRGAGDNRQVVVANMTADFESFGLGRQQARMLAEQTADFGTLGEMTTVAAVGIRVERAGILPRHAGWRDDCARSSAVSAVGYRAAVTPAARPAGAAVPGRQRMALIDVGHGEQGRRR